MSDKGMARHLARVAAVQVMYQRDVTGAALDFIVSNFVEQYAYEERAYKKMHKSFFKRLISKMDTDINFDEIIANSLDSDNNMNSAPLIMKSIIKVGIIELLFEKTDIPVIINEYVEIAKEFVGGGGVKFVNAILDKISRQMERKCQTQTGT
ncbi:MAG: transcription antitermination factor NusB [Holosporales bacterium]|jgi:N utilization substance protein B|nr:transcription antitermination factor NusB [Holosporales bacterium]